jgi:hypothetical protein
VVAGVVDNGSGILIALSIILGLMLVAYVIFLIVFSALQNSFIWSTIILIYNEYDNAKEEVVMISSGDSPAPAAKVDDMLEEELDVILEDDTESSSEEKK